jgi:ABC-2 type transport system ATP-binding protein
VVELEGLTKDFGGQRGVFGLDLAVAPGQVFGFLGPNGAGKSTTIRILMGLYLPTAGTARVLGLDATRDGPQVRARVGYLPGELALYSNLTGTETLDRLGRMPGHADTRSRAELVERFRAELDRPVRALSKGNRQKIGLILAFMHRPELLILDEPTSGLDPLLQKEFADLLEESIQRGASVFLSSHDLDEVQRLAHQIAIIREGRLVLVDTVEGLRACAPRTITLTFRTAPDPFAFASLPGVRVLGAVGPALTVTVDGEVGRLLAAAVPLGVVDVEARSADLDELFRTFYTAPEGAYVR